MIPEVSVVIVSFNTREHLTRCLAAVPAAAEAVPLEVIVVDNGSDDGSAHMVAERFPSVRLLRRRDNVGFGRASNAGAAAGTGRALLLLNSDCELRPGALVTMLRALDADATIGAVFCRLLNPDGTLQPSVHERLPSPWSHLADVVFASSLRHAIYRRPWLKRHLLRGTARRHARARDVAWGGAACMLVRRAAFDAVGGFDERFFMYCEDLDLCARLDAAGFRLRYVPDAAAVHGWGASTGQRPAAMLHHAYQSRIAYFAKHFPGWGGSVTRGLAALELGVRTAALGLAALVPGAGGAAARQRLRASAACFCAVCVRDPG